MVGNFLSPMLSPEMKLLLKFCISLYAALTWWLWVSTNCIWMFSSWRYTLIDFDATLSMILKLGSNPLLVMYLVWVWKYSIIVSSLVSFIGAYKIALVVQLYRINMSMYPLILLMSKFPVFLTYIFPSFLSNFANGCKNLIHPLSFYWWVGISFHLNHF